jgi:hypothetical protein
MRRPGHELVEDPYYMEITNELKRSLRVGDFRVGELLKQVLKEGLYGHWGTFAAYVTGELRISPQKAYRQIAAWDISLSLKSFGLPLPMTERQVRPLNQLANPVDQAEAWKFACQQKQFGSPTSIDVQREVTRLLRGPISQKADETYRIYKTHLEKMRTDIRRASDILASGELEPFLKSTEELNLRRQQRLLQLVHVIGIELGDHFRKLLGQAEVPFEERE